MGCLQLQEDYYKNGLKVVYKAKPKASREAKSAQRWLSVDPIALYDPINETEHYIDGQHNGGYFNPRNTSVYGYTYQNPVKYVDPNGKQAFFMHGTFVNKISMSKSNMRAISKHFNNTSFHIIESPKDLGNTHK